MEYIEEQIAKAVLQPCEKTTTNVVSLFNRSMSGNADGNVLLKWHISPNDTTEHRVGMTIHFQRTKGTT